jgi:hypothetical protein
MRKSYFYSLYYNLRDLFESLVAQDVLLRYPIARTDVPDAVTITTKLLTSTPRWYVS